MRDSFRSRMDSSTNVHWQFTGEYVHYFEVFSHSQRPPRHVALVFLIVQRSSVQVLIDSLSLNPTHLMIPTTLSSEVQNYHNAQTYSYVDIAPSLVGRQFHGRWLLKRLRPGNAVTTRASAQSLARRHHPKASSGCLKDCNASCSSTRMPNFAA